MQCQVCLTSGQNIKRCGKCNNVWCTNCATQGKGHYPKETFSNKCPYCGTYDQITRET